MARFRGSVARCEKLCRLSGVCVTSQTVFKNQVRAAELPISKKCSLLHSTVVSSCGPLVAPSQPNRLLRLAPFPTVTSDLQTVISFVPVRECLPDSASKARQVSAKIRPLRHSRRFVKGALQSLPLSTLAPLLVFSLPLLSLLLWSCSA